MGMVAKREPDWSYLISPEDAPAKQAILRAALHLFVEKGLAETSIRDIAKAAGYTNPALFKHFEGREALAFHIFERCFRRLGQAIAVARRPDQDFRANLRAVLTVALRTMDDQLEGWLFVQDNLRTFWPHLAPQLRPYAPLRQIRELLEQGVRERKVASKANLKLLVASMVGLLGQFSRMLYFGEFEGTALDHLEEIERLLLAQMQP